MDTRTIRFKGTKIEDRHGAIVLQLTLPGQMSYLSIGVSFGVDPGAPRSRFVGAFQLASPDLSILETLED